MSSALHLMRYVVFCQGYSLLSCNAENEKLGLTPLHMPPFTWTAYIGYRRRKITTGGGGGGGH